MGKDLSCYGLFIYKMRKELLQGCEHVKNLAFTTYLK